MKPQYTTVFVIRELSTRKLIKFGPKCAWTTSGAAKSAFKLHTGVLFDSQNDYVLEEIK